ncbi:MAG: hypothetical protein MUE40_09625 [Anaerolineae bacterium]|nr:hypothetical protein [Anaerolineae bacterium]
MSDTPPRGSARERNQRRRQQRETLPRRTGSARQIRPADAPRRELPRLHLPGLRWLLAGAGALLIVVAVLFISGAINPPEAETHPNAYWLGTRWTYEERSDAEVERLVRYLRDHDIGAVYAFVTSLLEDATLAGSPSEPGSRFNDVEPRLMAFVQRLQQAYPALEIYAWIEVQTTDSQGYRLDNPQVQRVVADLSQRAVQVMGFRGVLLDVKPVFDGNPDYPLLLQAVRRNIGLETPLLVAVPPDLTPTDAGLNLPPQIAPGTVWSLPYKQRIALQADTLVVTAYNSYLSDPVDYINWVTYQVQAFTAAMDAIETTSTLIISVPVFGDQLPAHDASVETLPAALDGVQRGVAALEETAAAIFQGVALFSDRDLTDSEWAVYQEKWGGR